MLSSSRQGDSLIELIVALVLLECIGAAALATALAVERLDRHAMGGAMTDAARWEEYRDAETGSTCAGTDTPDTGATVFPATADRPALSVTWRCGP
ncbi:MAG TPA: hypothetical protein VGL65_03270 [Gemmatimonadales bacterium]